MKGAIRQLVTFGCQLHALNDMHSGKRAFGRDKLLFVVQRLTGDGPTAMGSLFKAIGLSAPPIEQLPGFEP